MVRSHSPPQRRFIQFKRFEARGAKLASGRGHKYFYRQLPKIDGPQERSDKLDASVDEGGARVGANYSES